MASSGEAGYIGAEAVIGGPVIGRGGNMPRRKQPFAGETAQERAKRARAIDRRLRSLHGDARVALDFEGPLQLLVATILSAQCTDERVNQVTPALFARFPDARAYAGADPAELERMIHSTGFFRQKARSIQTACREIVERHGGEVPEGMAELTALPGVGRKTANVIRGGAWGHPGITVDTHVRRLSRRLGLTDQQDPEKIERELNTLLPKKDWFDFSSRLIFHGRRVCNARRPACGACPLTDLCRYYLEEHNGRTA
jgi:endonuclease-3